MKHRLSTPRSQYRRYARARWWAKNHARTFPGVRFTASICQHRLSYWVQDGQMHRRTWYVEQENK